LPEKYVKKEVILMAPTVFQRTLHFIVYTGFEEVLSHDIISWIPGICPYSSFENTV
jgi:hypothetical protein